MKPRLCIAIACAVACVTCVRNSQVQQFLLVRMRHQFRSLRMTASITRIRHPTQFSFMTRQTIACSA
jgi:hypothetical protein